MTKTKEDMAKGLMRYAHKYWVTGSDLPTYTRSTIRSIGLQTPADVGLSYFGANNPDGGRNSSNGSRDAIRQP